jgi:DNA polymerase-3 subunit gamma/tau
MAEAAHVAQPDIAPPMIPVPPMPAVEPPRAFAPVAVERAVAPVPAPAAVEPQPTPPPRPVAPPPRPVEALPPVSMKLPADSGLELVETRSKAVPMPEPEPAPPAGPRRVRPPRVVIPDEPLQIVETHKEGQPPAV